MSFRWTPGCCCGAECIPCNQLPDAEKISTSVYTSFQSFENIVKSQIGQDCQYGYMSFYGEEYCVPADYSNGLYAACGNVESYVPYMRYNQNASSDRIDRAVFSGLPYISSCYGDPFCSRVSYSGSRTVFENGSTRVFTDSDGLERIFETGLHYNSVYGFESIAPDGSTPGVRHTNIHYKWSLCKNVAYRAIMEHPTNYDSSSFGWSYYIPVQSTSIVRYGLDQDGRVCFIARIEAHITRWDASQRRERGFYIVWLCPMQTYYDEKTVYYDSTGSYYANQKDTISAEERLRKLLNGSYVDDTLPEGHQIVTVDRITGIQWLIPIAVESKTEFALNTVLNKNRKYVLMPEGSTYIDTFYHFTVQVNINDGSRTVIAKYDKNSDTAEIRVLDHIVRAQTVGEIGNTLSSSDLSGFTIEELTQPPEPTELISYTPPSVTINSYDFFHLYEQETSDW